MPRLKLPAPAPTEDPALRYVEQKKQWLSSNTVPLLGNNYMLDPTEGTRVRREVLTKMVWSGDRALVRAVADMGRNGLADANEVISECLVKLRTAHEPVPPDLEVYDLDRLQDRIDTRQPPGRKQSGDMFRDIAVTMLINDVRKLFGRPLSGRSPRRASAFMVVATAFRLDYETVRSIWYGLHHKLAPVFRM